MTVKKSISIPLKTNSFIERYSKASNLSYSNAVVSLLSHNNNSLIPPENLVDFQNLFNSQKDSMNPETYIILSKGVEKLWQM